MTLCAWIISPLASNFTSHNCEFCLIRLMWLNDAMQWPGFWWCAWGKKSSFNGGGVMSLGVCVELCWVFSPSSDVVTGELLKCQLKLLIQFYITRTSQFISNFISLHTSFASIDLIFIVVYFNTQDKKRELFLQGMETFFYVSNEFICFSSVVFIHCDNYRVCTRLIKLMRKYLRAWFNWQKHSSSSNAKH